MLTKGKARENKPAIGDMGVIRAPVMLLTRPLPPEPKIPAEGEVPTDLNKQQQLGPKEYGKLVSKLASKSQRLSCEGSHLNAMREASSSTHTAAANAQSAYWLTRTQTHISYPV